MTGHDKLIADLTELLTLAQSFEFHDFKNQRFAAPKMALVSRLRAIVEGAIGGRYDNMSNDEQ